MAKSQSLIIQILTLMIFSVESFAGSYISPKLSSLQSYPQLYVGVPLRGMREEDATRSRSVSILGSDGKAYSVFSTDEGTLPKCHLYAGPASEALLESWFVDQYNGNRMKSLTDEELRIKSRFRKQSKKNAIDSEPSDLEDEESADLLFEIERRTQDRKEAAGQVRMIDFAQASRPYDMCVWSKGINANSGKLECRNFKKSELREVSCDFFELVSRASDVERFASANCKLYDEKNKKDSLRWNAPYEGQLGDMIKLRAGVEKLDDVRFQTFLTYVDNQIKDFPRTPEEIDKLSKNAKPCFTKTMYTIPPANVMGTKGLANPRRK